MVQQTPLPFFRQKRTSANLNVPRRLELPVTILRATSFLPALINSIHNVQYARDVPLRDAGSALYIQTTQSEYYVAVLWCLLAGYWNWILATSMMKRWLYQYDIKHAFTRLLILNIFTWCASLFIHSLFNKQDPIITEMATCFFLLLLNFAKLMFASDRKFIQKTEDMLPSSRLSSTPIRILALPLVCIMTVSVFMLSGQIHFFQYRSLLLMHEQQYELDSTVSPTMGGLTVLVVIMSSWTSKGAEKRQILRESTVNWMNQKSNDINFVYRFVVGQPPSSRIQSWLGPKLVAESEKYHDILVVPAPDSQTDKSRKLYETLKWASSSVQHDYFIKTDDDVFARYDVIRQELASLGQQDNYWKGFVYRNMPAEYFHPTNNMNVDYAMPILPAFTAGTLFTLSRNIVDLIAEIDYPQRFIDADDINLSMWLFGFDIEPIHDRRIQDLPEVCEESFIAKRFTDVSDLPIMYDNLLEKKPQCYDLDKQKKCAVCYPCFDKSNDWRSLILNCDNSRGVSLLRLSEYKKIASFSVKDELEPSIIGKNDQWIIKDVMSARTSVYTEDEANWHLLYWVCWTSEPDTFTDRHWRALEMVWIHEPEAAIFMISNSLPEDFFHEYTRRGYNIRVVNFNKENLLTWKWYFGPGTQDWLEAWDKWEKGKFFYWHLTDYIRCLLLYNYGGTYMDMDALWVRIPPDHNLEFIGSDYSSVTSDLEWTLDDKGLYLPQGLMRFKRGWKLFREMAEGAFSAYNYDPECFNCGGPKAITSYVRDRRSILEGAGLTILPRKVLYPYSYLEIHQLLQPNPLAEQDMKLKIEPSSWNIHLFGKMTNHLPVQPNSMIDYVFKKFDLDVPHRDTRTHNIISSTQTTDVPMRLVGPRDYVYRTVSQRMLEDDQKKQNLLRLHSKPGKFQGIHVIYVRGGPDVVPKAVIEVETTIGKSKILNGTLEKQITLVLENASMKEVNSALNSIDYRPSPLMRTNGGRDRLRVKVTFDQGEIVQVDQLQITLIVMEPEEEDVVYEEALDEEEKKLLLKNKS